MGWADGLGIYGAVMSTVAVGTTLARERARRANVKVHLEYVEEQVASLLLRNRSTEPARVVAIRLDLEGDGRNLLDEPVTVRARSSRAVWLNDPGLVEAMRRTQGLVTLVVELDDGQEFASVVTAVERRALGQ